VNLPPPGTVGAQAAIAGFDSLHVSAGEGGAWEGFEAALGRARAGPGIDGRPGDGRRARTDLTFTSGSNGLRDNAVSLWRGDSLGGLRIEAASGERGAAGGIAGGRDLYGIAGATVRGPHRIEGAFAHRRANARLAGGEAEDARDEAGRVAYRRLGDRWRLTAALVRGYGHHDSDGPGGTLPERRRLADATAGDLTIERAGTRDRWGVRGSWRETAVTPDAQAGGRVRARALWGAARWQGPVGEGELEIAVGAGHHDALRATPVAPSLVWRFRGAPWDGRVTFERLLTPVWSDLAPGESPFLQDTWAGGLDLGAASPGGGRARAGFLAGHTRHRAILERRPLEALALRSGMRAEAQGYDFGLVTAEAGWRTRRWGIAIEGFVLARDASALQPQVDPARGGRALIEAGFSLFGGDLQVRPRCEVWAVGPRESEAVPSRALPGYGLLTGALELTVADATVLIEGRNLGDHRTVRTWVDSATGVEAPGPGRELRMSLIWRLWD
jgi:hypothetical protein